MGMNLFRPEVYEPGDIFEISGECTIAGIYEKPSMRWRIKRLLKGIRNVESLKKARFDVGVSRTFIMNPDHPCRIETGDPQPERMECTIRGGPDDWGFPFPRM